jgi:hypothetical protein
MAIGPNQLNESFMEEVNSFEKKIDSILSNKKVAPNSSVNIDLPSGLTYSHFQILKNRYISAGWGEVKWNRGHWAGQWLTFDTKKPTSSDWEDR